MLLSDRVFLGTITTLPLLTATQDEAVHEATSTVMLRQTPFCSDFTPFCSDFTLSSATPPTPWTSQLRVRFAAFHLWEMVLSDKVVGGGVEKPIRSSRVRFDPRTILAERPAHRTRASPLKPCERRCVRLTTRKITFLVKGY